MNYDVVIVGTGPGGAMLSRQLARAGKRVLILERGRDWRDHPLYGTYGGPLLYAEKRSLLFTREGMSVIRPMMVGGATSMFAGCSAPPRDWWRSEYGIDLTVHAAAIHRELGIAPLPAALRGEASTRVAEAATDLGMDWFPQEKFVWPDRAMEFNCGAHCLLGCRCGAKWNAGELIDDAVAAGAELWTRARVDEVMRVDDHVAGVRGSRLGRSFDVACDTVVLAAGGIGTPHIMRATGFPHAGVGIAMDTTIMVYGRSLDKGMGGDPPMTWSYEDRELGVMYSTLLDPWLMYPIMMARQGATLPFTWRRWSNTYGVMIKLTDELSGGIDDRGAISKGVTIADQRKIDKATAVATRILHRAGCRGDTVFSTPLRGTHPSATVRIGELVDVDLQTELPGLYVCDASVFPRALGSPTVLTILSLARRLAESLTGRDVPIANNRTGPVAPDE